jgi:hypothetical protein
MIPHASISSPKLLCTGFQRENQVREPDSSLEATQFEQTKIRVLEKSFWFVYEGQAATISI